MIDAILLSCLSAQVMVVWFETNAFYEYMSLFKVGRKFFKLDKFEEYLDSELQPGTYPCFLVQKSPTFFNKLISCPYCLNVYICAFIFLALNDHISFWYYSFVYIISLVILLIIKKLI